LENSENPVQSDTSTTQPKTLTVSAVTQPLPSAFSEELHQEAQRLFEQQISASTKRAYAADWQIFSDWCHNQEQNFFSLHFDRGKCNIRYPYTTKLWWEVS
jgi:hypothetical protein